MCDLCSGLLDLLHTYELKSNCIETIPVKKDDIAAVCSYVQGWAQKQCTCCYKEAKLFEAFNNLIQNILRVSLQFLNQLAEDLQNSGKTSFAKFIAKKELSIVELPFERDKSANLTAGKDGLNSDSKVKSEIKKEQVSSLQVEAILDSDEEEWSLDDNEKLLHFISKVFLLNFPLYVAYKHSVHSKMEFSEDHQHVSEFYCLQEISQHEFAALSIYCDINDPEIPVFLVRNVCFFCDQGGINAMTAAFHSASPETLPFSLAHAMIAVVSNLKLWMNIGTIVQCLVPLRTNVIRYMCKLSDKDLRVTGTRNMSEFMWTAVKDPLDAHLTFDREGLDLAFKYFVSSTLTMRLAGIAQINNHINMYTELCNSETFMETESVGLALANWLIQNKVIEHIFGPNLHVEIIKQSHYVLNFLATEGRITNDHIDCIWAAAQLKHCSKQVHDLLPPLIKNLEAHPALRLYYLLCKLETKEHTEQTLCLASALIKFIWSSGGGPHGTLAMAEYPTSHSPFTAMLKGSINVSELEKAALGSTVKRNVSSSEHSVSVEASNSDEEEPSDCQPVQNTSEPDSSQLSDKRASSNDGSEEGVKKRLQQISRKKKALHQRPKNRKRMISRREPGEIAEIDDSSASSAALDSDLSNVSNDSLPTDCEGVGENSGLRVSGLSTMSETDDDSGNEDSSMDDKVQETRCKMYRHRQKLGATHRITEKAFLAGHSKAVQSKEMSTDEMAAAKINLEENLKRAGMVFTELTEDKEECYRGMHADLSIKDLLEDGDDERVRQSEELEKKSDLRTNTDKSITEDKQDIETEKKIKSKKGELDPSILEVENIVAKITHEKIDSEKLDDKVKDANINPVFRESQDTDAVSREYPQLGEATENEIYDCREYLEHIHSQRHIREPSDMVEDILSPDDGSCSSRISNKSEKNMADFDGEESGCEEELVQLTARTQSHLSPQQMHQHFATMSSMYRSHVHHAKVFHRYAPKEQQITAGHFDIDKVCKPGHTLLWDLLQDEVVGQLGEGLAAETEKTLCNLVCWSTDRVIRMKFIEGCLENLATNRSVVISLRLLPKLFGSFQQYRVGMDTHAITLWAEREHKMMKHFFNNLLTYTTIAKKMEIHSPLMCSHQTEIQVRLQFLTCVFSSMGSPDNFRLTLEQVDTLWSCLAFDQECSDELFSWLLNQAKNKDQHAMGLDTFKHIFLEKMPLLPPETTSMTALNLYQQLSSLTHLAASASDETSISDLSGMDQLWGIALRAENTDVSMAAIQYLNSYYINIHHGTLEKEDEFIERCMNNLYTASQQLNEAEDANLIIIQRGLLLLKTHLETFQRRYSYHLRLWYLDGCGIMRHQKSLAEKQATPLRIVCQPGGLSDKVTFEMLGSDYVAELRAEVTRWWEQLQRAQQKRKNVESGTSSQDNSDISSGMPPTEGPIRMISQGQELSADLDERTLQDMGFKDMQLVFVSVGAARPQRKREGLEPTSQLPAPPRFKLPMELLLQTSHFEQLFCLMQQLSSLKVVKNVGDWMPHTKGQLLSRRVWELLMMLPTCPTILQGFQSLVSKTVDRPNELSFEKLIDPASPQKLMYSLQIVESLAKPSRSKIKTLCVGDGDNVNKESIDSKGEQDLSFTEEFIKQGGLRHIFGIFMSGVLQSNDEDANEWKQDCLAYLLKLVNQFGIDPNELEIIREDVIDNYETPRKKTKKNRRGSNEKSLVPRLNTAMLELMEVEPVMNALMRVLEEAATLKDPNFYKTGFWGRAQVVHYTIGLLVHWSFSCDAVKVAFFSRSTLAKLLKRLLLDDPEPEVRREACTGQYRLCLGTTIDGKTGQKYIAPLLACLLSFLSDAQAMKCIRLEPEEDGKEPYGSACRDYFWLTCRLVDSLDEEIVKEFNEQQQTAKLDLDSLIKYLVESILSREYLETRHTTAEDDGLIGLLTLCTAVMKHNPPFKFSQEGQAFLLQLFDCLFALPSPKQRYLPKCKSNTARSAAYDLIIELIKKSIENYTLLHKCLLKQHSPDSHSPYPWDYWPHEDGRSDCGYVGLTNLGATCYMASCMQHLYMMPQARVSILAAKCNEASKHENTLHELQRMFAYLLESERKAYNPKSFCKVYVMDHQPLNTGEQKDMAEFFTDLISKLEEMTPQLKELVKTLFCGVITNNVVSLDCPHVSRTIEEFYTVRCQVADMRNLYESLDEVTVKDTLEGDNMYTCSQCGKKVRAEKRACFKKLPKIICFNTMRYTFNMVTMMKEKVNTHFSFPLRLDMSGYIEKNLMPEQYKVDDCSKDDEDNYFYDLIGVTVHTGTADGGHYYSFIRDRTSVNRDKWFLFNDAEVKPFDPAQIAAECFGGEMTVKFSKTYDSVTDKFMDFSFEKTNSAYMLFYERSVPDTSEVKGESKFLRLTERESNDDDDQPQFELSKELAEWIWQDNMQFLQDKNIFEHTYFNFMWQICGYIPQTMSSPKDVTLMSAKLSTSFVLETLIHAKEKPTMVQWIELLTKQCNSSQSACEWFMDHMAENDWWPVQILIKCPNQVVRQMFHRLCIHVINKLKPVHSSLYLQPYVDSEDSSDESPQVGRYSCVTRFIRKLLSLIEHGAKQHCKHLTEYFTFLLEFAKMGDEESQFLIGTEAIAIMVNFYLGQKTTEYIEVVSDDDEDDDDDVISIVDDKYKPASLEKMITLVATLVEKSRGEDRRLGLSENDSSAVAGGKGFPFLFQQIRDNINIRQTCNLIFSLTRWNERLGSHIISMIFQAITKHNELNQPFFKLMSLLVEFAAGPPGLPSFTNIILQRIWEVAEYCPQQVLEWLAMQVPRNKIANTWALSNMETWVEHFLIAHINQRVRHAAAVLLVNLVPSNSFRQAYRTARTMLSPQKEITMNGESVMILHQIYDLLLRLLKRAKHFVDPAQHGTTKLMSYFALMTYCLVSRTERLMFGQYFLDLWQLFQPKLSEPPISVHHNKQALLIFWYQVCIDCPENVKLIVQNAHVTKNIAFNYILADHDDQDVMVFNRCMLPAYYGLLRLCCQQSRVFTRQLANHQNIQWAFKNITPYTTQYSAAIDELFKLMRLFVMQYPDSTEQEIKDIHTFKRMTLQLYLGILDARSCWTTLITACRILLESNEDRLFLLYNNGLPMMFEAFLTLHVMYHEATACHVVGDLVELLSIISEILKCVRMLRENKEVKHCLLNWKDRVETAKKLITLLNSYTTSELRHLCIEVLRELVMLYPGEILQTLVPLLTHCHATFQENNVAVTFGPYFPKQGQKLIVSKSNIRPQRPMFQMFLHPSQIEVPKGLDEDYDQSLLDFFFPYHQLVDMLCRMAINHDLVTDGLVSLSAMVGFEGIPMHLGLFPKLWLDIYQAEHIDKKYIEMLCTSNYLVDYLEAVLLDEQPSLNNPIIYQFCSIFFPKVYHQVVNEQLKQQINNFMSSFPLNIEPKDLNKAAYKINGELRVLVIVLSTNSNQAVEESFIQGLRQLQQLCDVCLKRGLHQEDITESQDAPNTEKPAKRRKISETSSESASLSVCTEPELSQEGSSKSLVIGGPSTKTDNPNWIEILSQTISHLLVRIQELNKMST